MLDLRVVVASDYLSFALPTVEEAITKSNGEIVAIESKVNSVSLNRSIKKRHANLLILALSKGGSICQLIKDVKRKHPEITIITIAGRLKQIPKIVKTKMVQAILFISEGVEELVKAIREVTIGNDYYSPQVISRIVHEITNTKLTPREKEISDLINKNKTRSEIAKILEISYYTVIGVCH